MSLATALTIAELAWVAGMSVVIMLEKRSPLATVSWIFGMALLPLVGLVVWLLMGPRRLRKRRSVRAQVRERIDASWPYLLSESRGEAANAVEPHLRQLMALGLNNVAAPLLPGNAVRLLRNGNESFASIEEAIRAAQHHVHVEFYIFADDETGRRFRDVLVEVRKRGVEVRLLVDGVGARGRMGFFRPLVEAGGEVGEFNPVAILRLGTAFNARNHRKLVVCDGRVAFTGGLNVANEYVGRPPDVSSWRDTHARFDGPCVQAFQRVFLQDWNFATGRSVTDRKFFEICPAVGPHLVQVVGSGPDDNWHAVEQLVVAAIHSAHSRVRITTPYFVPDEPLFTALVTASLRGVDVEILVPRRADSAIVLAASRSFFDELLAAGVRIFEYMPTMLHAKTMSIDGSIAFVGTANMDPRSFRLNYELTAIAYCEETARGLDDFFEKDLTVSNEVTSEGRQSRSALSRLAEAAARPLSPLL